MKKISKPVGIAALIVGVGILAALASVVGGISIRALPQQPNVLGVTAPLLPGVPFTIRFSELATIQSPSVVLRSENYEVELPIEVTEEHIISQLPCSVTTGKHELFLRNAVNKQVLAATTTDVLPPGPDCISTQP